MRFEIGAASPISLRHETIAMELLTPLRLLYVSDLHLGNRWSTTVVEQIGRHAREVSPHVILLGGDIADSEAGLPHVRRMLQQLGSAAPIACVFGNHDHGSHFRALCEALDRANVWRLKDQKMTVAGVDIVGSITQISDSSRSILCAHDPADYSKARGMGVHLTIAGHLHGGQCVLWESNQRQYPGALINRYTLTRQEDAGTTLLVSRGAADSLPLRFRCPRELLLIDLS